MATEHALAQLAEVVKAHRKKLTDVGGQTPADRVVLEALDTLLEIQELKLEAQVQRLIEARRAPEDDDAFLASLEPRPPRRRPRAH